jgi:hypothetical protein
MSAFTDACEAVTEALNSEVLVGVGEQAAERASDPLREEVRAVAPCADRFVDYEVDPPPHGKAVGQAVGPAIIPPLSKAVGDARLSKLDSAGREELRAGIATSLAWGYLGLASVGEISWQRKAVQPRLDVEPAELWQLWVPYLSSGLDELQTRGGEADRTLRAARAKAMDQFTATLKALDLMPGLLKRMRVKLVGQKYVDNGMILRLVQGAQEGTRVPGFSRDMVERNWPFERPAPEAQ